MQISEDKKTYVQQTGRAGNLRREDQSDTGFYCTGTNVSKDQDGRQTAHHLRAAQIEGLLVVGLSDAQNALHTVVNESEAACLEAIAPHFNVLGGCEHLQTYGHVITFQPIHTQRGNVRIFAAQARCN